MVATMARLFGNKNIEKIENDLKVLLEQPGENIPKLMELINRYQQEIIKKKNSLYDNPTCNDILYTLKTEIEQKLPNYSKEKLASFLILLADVIRYVYRTCNDPKDNFPELYDPNEKLESVFQNSIYKSLRQGGNAEKYIIEPSGMAGGGRLDIVMAYGDLRFPLEVKKTSHKPNWVKIKQDYLTQAQNYAHSNHQLGILMVFDLEEKTKTDLPFNNIRDLFKLLRKDTYYDIEDNHPDYIVVVIVPANKKSPSYTSKYS